MLWWLHLRGTRRDTVEPPIELRVVEHATPPPKPLGAVQTPAARARQRQPTHRSTRGSRAANESGSVSRYTARGDFGLSAHLGRPNDFTEHETSGWLPEMWGSEQGDARQIVHALRFDQLMKEIDQMLHYPSVLGSRGISGVVNVRLIFDGASGCAWNKLKIYTGHAYLKTYVLAVLKKFCDLDTIRTFGYHEGQAVDLSFAFLFTDELTQAAALEGPGRVTGNVLLFTRTFPRPKLEYQLGPIRGLWFVPAVSLDWPWVVEHWEQWVDGKDPLKDFKAPAR